jgi:Ser/Thr protein kinase RdoA (MazF antagonist)
MTKTFRLKITDQSVKDIIREHYQIKIEKVGSLPAYLGNNYSLIDNQNRKYVFKISPPSEQKENLQFENQESPCYPGQNPILRRETAASQLFHQSI